LPEKNDFLNIATVYTTLFHHHQ